MLISKAITGTLAAAAIATAGLTAAPAQARNDDALNVLAGVAAVAVIASVIDSNGHHRSYNDGYRSNDYYAPAPRRTYYYQAPRYYAPAPRVVYVPAPYYDHRGHGHRDWRRDHDRYDH